MKTVIRYQSQLLPRRSYKPGRKVRVTFRPSFRGAVPLLAIGKERIRLPTVKPTEAASSKIASHFTKVPE